MPDGQPDYISEERITVVNVTPERPGQSSVPYPPPPEQWIVTGIEDQRLPE